MLVGADVTLAVIDWVMSLEPHWFSTMYGMLFMVIVRPGGAVVLCGRAAEAVRSGAAEGLRRAQAVKRSRQPDAGIHVLWTYMSFSQLLIIWSGNLKNEIPWYLMRARSGDGAQWRYFC